MIDLRRTTAAGLATAITLATPAVRGEGGEVPEDILGTTPNGAVPITTLPFTDTGNTCDNLDDFDAVCPYAGSTSPDVFYSFTPAEDMTLYVELCESAYDTKAYVLDRDLFVIACNDDACSDSQGNPFRSLIAMAPLTGGEKHYIGVDGFGGDCGFYEIWVRDGDFPNPCLVECGPGDTLEEEPCRFGTGGFDDTNGGCNSSPPVFSPISCDEVYCSTGYYDGTFRDTDWYEMFCAEETQLTMIGIADFDMVFGVVDTGFVPDCDRAVTLSAVTACRRCDICPSDPVVCPAGGTAWFFVAHDFSEVTDCMSDPVNYRFLVACDDPPCTPCAADLDGDCTVGFSDLLGVTSSWGPCP